MNNPSPLVPQGSFLEQKSKGRARVKVAVFVVLAVHGIGLLALLMQGCKKDTETGASPPGDQAALETNATAPAFEPTNAPSPDTNLPPSNSQSTAVAPFPAPSTPGPAPAATEYKIQKGDSFSSLAHKFHVSVKALMEANPNVQPTRLQIGQTIQVPAPTVPTSAVSSNAEGSVETANGDVVYSVKSGDTLSFIAHKYHVTVRAIESANQLKTTSIKVGQKLKIPVKASTAAQTPAEPAPASADTSAPPSAPAPQ
jgi:LysM repeat protein